MKKILLLLALFALCAHNVDAKSVTVEQAMAIAQQYYSGTPMMKGAVNPVLKLNYVGKNLKGTNDYYVFNRGNNQGFVIVAGDDLSTPILGYSDKGSFDINQAPEYLVYLLDQYQYTLEDLRNSKPATPSLRFNPDGVTPLLDNVYGEHPHWDQFEPYNNYCPRLSTGTAYAGCAAVAFAHIMKYHEHPYRGSGENTYSYVLNNQTMTVTSNFASHYYNFRNMKNAYKSTSSGWQNLAQLIFDAGASFNTRYSTSSSDASYKDIVKGMIAHFDYNPNIQFLLKQNYAEQTWREMVYTEIDSGRPVYYFGYRTIANDGSQCNVGHAFVMDGYDSEGRVRVIWGFQQDEYNSYFDFGLLSPRMYGNTPYANDSIKEGFNSQQDAIMGIRPANQDEPGGVVLKSVTLVADTMPANDVRAFINVQALSGPWSGTLRCGIVSKSSSGTYSTMYNFNKEVSMAENDIASIDISDAYPYLSNGQTYYIVVWSPYFPNNYDWNWFLGDPVPFTVGDWVTPPDPEWQLGDVNHDGEVDVLDVTMMISYILGENPEGFYLSEANVDGDAEGAIDVADVTATIAIILGGE